MSTSQKTSSDIGLSLPANKEQWKHALSDVGTLGILVRGLLMSEEKHSRPRYFRQKARDLEQDGLHSKIAGISGPLYSDLPFGEAVRPFLKPSERAVAERSGVSRSELKRMISGESSLTVERLEAVARAVCVNPGYFREYREMRIAAMVNAQLAKSPEIWLSVYHALSPADS